MENRLENAINGNSNSRFPGQLPPTSQGHTCPTWQCWGLGAHYLRTSGLRNFLSYPWNEMHQINRSHFFTFAYPPVIACRRLALKVVESVSSVAELTKTSTLDNSMSAWSYCLRGFVPKAVHGGLMNVGFHKEQSKRLTFYRRGRPRTTW